MTTRGIVFDLDGTLVDSFADITAAFCRSFTTLGLDSPTPEAVRPLMGQPLRDMYLCFADVECVETLIRTYRADYAERCADATRPFSGIVPLLADLGRAGIPRAVATTKTSWMARTVAARVGLTPLLDHVQGTDGFAYKPAPDVVQHAVAALPNGATWMVGDSWLDIAAGRAAGLRTCAVTWGVDAIDHLHAASPDELVETVDDLRALLLDAT